jgi:hypothetical protein
MAFELCKNGHYFDSAKYGQCRFCVAADSVAAPDVDIVTVNGGSSATPPAPVVQAVSDPPVGWLVIVGGPNCGADFTIHAGDNTIGRSPAMAVALDTDPTVAENQLSVLYDSRSNRFLARPGTAALRSYVNGEAVESSVGLQRGDKLQVGNTTLLFVPLAGERFQWPVRSSA